MFNGIPVIMDPEDHDEYAQTPREFQVCCGEFGCALVQEDFDKACALFESLCGMGHHVPSRLVEIFREMDTPFGMTD